MTKPSHIGHHDNNSDSLIDDDALGGAGADAGGGFASGAFGVASGAAGLSYSLFLTESGDTSAVSVNDIHQGALGDCFLLSALGELALYHPSSITSMIHDNGNGTQTVRLYESSNGRLPTFGTYGFRSVQETVSDVFDPRAANGGATQDVVGSQKEIWVQVEEKAVAMLDGGYNAIAYGGSPVIALEELTGKAATYASPGLLSLASLQACVAAGDLMVFDTSSAGSAAYDLVGDHAYMFDGLTTSGGSVMVNLLNPWGMDQPKAIAFQNLRQAGIVEIDIGQA